jgi:hypothetical protein
MKWSILILLLVPFASVEAQVSCSPNVGKKVCGDAALILNPLVDHGAYRGVAIQVEIVTAPEYDKRLTDLKDLEKRETDIPTNCLSNRVPAGFSSCYRHNLSNAIDPDITFFRDNPSSPLVSSVLISSARFNGLELAPKPGSPNNESVLKQTDRYDPSNLSAAASFIAGYLSGTMSRAMDGTGEPLVPSSPEK